MPPTRGNSAYKLLPANIDSGRFDQRSSLDTVVIAD